MWYSQLPCLTFNIKGSVWRTSRLVYLLCRWERRLAGFSHIGVVDRWPATPKRARYSALIAFLGFEDKYASSTQIALTFHNHLVNAHSPPCLDPNLKISIKSSIDLCDERLSSFIQHMRSESEGARELIRST